MISRRVGRWSDWRVATLGGMTIAHWSSRICMTTSLRARSASTNTCGSVSRFSPVKVRSDYRDAGAGEPARFSQQGLLGVDTQGVGEGIGDGSTDGVGFGEGGCEGVGDGPAEGVGDGRPEGVGDGKPDGRTEGVGGRDGRMDGGVGTEVGRLFVETGFWTTLGVGCREGIRTVVVAWRGGPSPIRCEAIGRSAAKGPLKVAAPKPTRPPKAAAPSMISRPPVCGGGALTEDETSLDDGLPIIWYPPRSSVLEFELTPASERCSVSRQWFDGSPREIL